MLLGPVCVLVVAGLMSIAWMVLLTLAVFVEKVFPQGQRISTAIGVAFVAPAVRGATASPTGREIAPGRTPRGRRKTLGGWYTTIAMALLAAKEFFQPCGSWVTHFAPQSDLIAKCLACGRQVTV